MAELKCLTVAVLTAFVGASCAYAQDLALKTNLLGDALLNPNVAIEVGVAPKWTVNTSGELNLWSVNGHKWRHWVVQPEARYWFCHRFQGHFLGVHALGGEYNVGGIDIPASFLGTDFRKLKDSRFQGWFGGAGIGYGYDWIINRHWNIEAEIGIGWTHTRYDKYPCAVCGRKLESGHHNYFGPTKAAINLTYVF